MSVVKRRAETKREPIASVAVIPQGSDNQNGEQDRRKRATQSKNRELVQGDANGERAAQRIVRDLDQRDANGSTDGQAEKPGRRSRTACERFCLAAC